MLLDLRVGALREPLSGRYLDPAGCHRQIIARAVFLQRAGLRRHDRVFLHYGNNIEFFVDLYATWLLGGCPVPLDPRLTAFEIETLAVAARPRFSVWDTDPSEGIVTRLRALEVEILRSTDIADGSASTLPRGLPFIDDAALMLFTSGTTGSPKGVVHSHRSLRSRLASERDVLGLEAFARTLCIVPTNFAWGLVGNCLYAWLSGQELVLMPAFRSDVLLRLGALCDEHDITYLPSVPSMWRTALRMSAPPKKGTLRRIAACTAPLPAATWRDIGKWGSTNDVVNIYGMTECGWMTWCTSATTTPEDGLVGVPFGCAVHILPFGTTDSDIAFAEPCAPGEAGYVWVQTPALMRGYLDRDDLTEEVISRGCFVTGDLGSFDERGQLFLRGRDKELINVGGVKVYPADVDAALLRSGLVADACTFAAPDPAQGELVAVAVVLPDTPGAEVSAVFRWTKEHLASYQLPRAWYLVSEVPRTARGKLNRTQVAQLCSSQKAIDIRTLDRS
jgi:acyl-CoA synthetase (AMP-forming)/AMP-acid ligase II